jgi:hypothetical protein
MGNLEGNKILDDGAKLLIGETVGSLESQIHTL